MPGSADVHTSLAKISVVHISMVCIQAWFALKPDAESGLCAYKPGLCAYKPGFYPRLYRNCLPLWRTLGDRVQYFPELSRFPFIRPAPIREVTILKMTVQVVGLTT